MKVTLVFCLIAIYGAVAQEVGTDAIKSDSSSSESGISIGGGLEAVNDLIQAAITAKGKSVAQGVGVIDTAITSVTDFGSNFVKNGTTLAQSAIQMGGDAALEGMNVAGKVVNQTMDFVDSIPVVGKIVPTSIIKGIFSKGTAIGGKAVKAGTSAGKTGAGFGGKIGKGILGGVGTGTSEVTGIIVAGDELANTVASNVATAAMNGASKGIKGVGSMISSVGNKLTTSATLKTAPSTDSKKPTA